VVRVDVREQRLDTEQQRRFQDLKDKAEGPAGLTDDEANELGYLYALDEGRPYARHVEGDPEEAVKEDPRLDAEEVERVKAEVEGETDVTQQPAYGKRPADSNMYGAAVETREGDSDIVESH
jgi:hypothetical protein